MMFKISFSLILFFCLFSQSWAADSFQCSGTSDQGDEISVSGHFAKKGTALRSGLEIVASGKSHKISKKYVKKFRNNDDSFRILAITPTGTKVDLLWVGDDDENHFTVHIPTKSKTVYDLERVTCSFDDEE